MGPGTHTVFSARSTKLLNSLSSLFILDLIYGLNYYFILVLCMHMHITVQKL